MTAQFLMGLIGFGGGVVAASGAAALVIGLGIIPRYAGISRTPGRILWYEDCAMLGILLGNLTVLWQGEIPLGNVGLAVFGIFAGIFLGSWIIALGEVVDVFAILARRLKLHHTFPWVIVPLVAGKFLGSLLYFGKGWY